jgi:uncharacterized tellurite resistance protein B-like protein
MNLFDGLKQLFHFMLYDQQYRLHEVLWKSELVKHSLKLDEDELKI